MSNNTLIKAGGVGAKERLRVLLTSDIHYNTLMDWYGVKNEDRAEMWLRAVMAEHERVPFDAMLFLGDYSLDNHGHIGAYEKRGVSETDIFLKKYVSQLPDGIPKYFVAGNHEKYEADVWESITGNTPDGAVLLGDNAFIMLDSFTNEIGDEEYDIYKPADMDYIKAMLDICRGKHIYLCAHWFEPSLESDEFRRLLASGAVTGLFAGHSHLNSLISLGPDFGNAAIAQTGNFSYTLEKNMATGFWGFRELVITPDIATTRYIVAESDAVINGKKTHFDRTVCDEIVFYW